MEITLGLPSRGRPAGLLSVLTALHHLSTGENAVNYAVILDDDDYVTLEQVEHWKKSGFFPERTYIKVAPRQKTVNARFNDAVAEHPADLYGQICDDAFPLTQHWDAIFAKCTQLPAFAWEERNDPLNVTYPVVSERWRSSIGRVYPEHFPFWFADTWIAETYRLAFGHPLSVFKQLGMGGRRGHTTGMRDLAFWFHFFAETRHERIAEAERLAEIYGCPVDVRSARREEIEQMQAADNYQLSRVAIYEAAFRANTGEPSEMYQVAKDRAEMHLRERMAA
jgi:hypothetical protein